MGGEIAIDHVGGGNNEEAAGKAADQTPGTQTGTYAEYGQRQLQMDRILFS